MLTAPLLWLFTTQAGLIFTLNFIKDFSKISLEFEQVQGSFASKISADRINYQDENVDVTIEKLSTNLRLFWLLDAELAFGETIINKAQIRLKDNPEQKADYQPSALPIGISLDNTSIETLVVIDTSPIVELTAVNAKGITIEHEIELEKLAFAFPAGQVKIAGNIDLAKNMDIDIKADWQLIKTKQSPALSGTTVLDGTLLKLRSKTSLIQPQKLIINAEILDIMSDLRWSASIDSPAINLALFNVDLETILKDTKVVLSGNKLSATIKGDTILEDPDYGHWKTSINGELGASHWQISTLELKSLKSPASINAQIKSNTESPYSSKTGIEVIANWQKLQWPVTGKADYTSNTGQGKYTGTLENYQINLNGKFSYDNYLLDDINISGVGNKEELQLNSVSTSYLEGQWTGKSTISWVDGFKWQASFNIKNANPALQWPDLPGKLNGTVSAEGSHQKDTWSISGNITNLSGIFREYPLKGNSNFSVTEKEYAFRNLNIQSGNNTLSGNIAMQNYQSNSDAQIQADWNINARNLAQLFPQTAGSIASKGKLHGLVDTPTIDATMNAKDFQYLDYRINNGEIKAAANLQKNEKLKIAASLQNSVFKGTSVENITLDISGTTYAHEVIIDSKFLETYSLNLKAKSGFQNSSWNGKLTSINVNADKYGEWKLSTPVSFQNKGDQWTLDNACMALKTQQTLACFGIKANQALALYALEGKLSDLSLPYFQTLMPEYVNAVEGTVTANISLEVENRIIQELSIAIKSDSGNLAHTIINKAPEKVTYRDLYINAKKYEQNIVLSGNVDMQKTGKVTAKLTLPGFISLSNVNTNQPIEGMVNVELKDLSPFVILIPDVQSIEGETLSNFQISGTLGSPILTGKSSLLASKITLPLAGLELKDTKLKAHSLRSKKMIFEGVTHSGDGQLTIKGNMPDYAAEKIKIELEAKGNQFLAVKTPDVEMELSPELHLILLDNVVNLDGSVNIDRARITLLDSFAGLTPSSDVVLVDPQKQAAKESPLILKGKIRLVLSDRIFVQGSGFIGRITGELLIEESPGEVTRATGELVIKDGRYSSPIKGDNIPSLLLSIAQKELLINEGKLIFSSSPIDNPRLDIQARRTVGTEIVVGVDIKGHVNNPQITLYSEPAMDQVDILAYLTLGYPITAASENDGKYLASVATSIGLVGGEKIAKGLATRFGIDEVYIRPEESTQQAQLVLGKYLSPKLYVRYAIGLGEAVDTLQIQYKLTDRWILHTESAVTKQGTDLIYTIEKD
jgi:translocation and assembly module TamB